MRFCRPRCDLCGRVCLQPAGQSRGRQRRILQSLSSVLDNAPSTRRPGAIRRAAVGVASGVALAGGRSDSVGRRRKTYSRWQSRVLRHGTERRPDPGIHSKAAMLVRKLLHRAGETLVPFRPILFFQKRIGRFHGRDFGQSQLLDQAILRGPETPFNPPFGLRGQLQRMQTVLSKPLRLFIHTIR